MSKNIPYVKKFDENGVLLNPVTKSNPYFSPYPNRRQRRATNKYFHPINSTLKYKRAGNNRKKSKGRKSILKNIKTLISKHL